jgi:hypothetical protein
MCRDVYQPIQTLLPILSRLAISWASQSVRSDSSLLTHQVSTSGQKRSFIPAAHNFLHSPVFGYSRGPSCGGRIESYREPSIIRWRTVRFHISSAGQAHGMGRRGFLLKEGGDGRALHGGSMEMIGKEARRLIGWANCVGGQRAGGSA